MYKKEEEVFVWKKKVKKLSYHHRTLLKYQTQKMSRTLETLFKNSKN